MRDTILHAGKVTQWFKMLLLLLFLEIFVTMVDSGILFGVIQPILPGLWVPGVFSVE